MMELASATTPAASQIGAVLILSPDGPLDFDAVSDAVNERIRAVPRLRQRLMPTPLGGGRPVWVDDASFHIGNHLEQAACPAPGDRSAVLDLAADLVARPLPRHRPLWSATLVVGLADGAAALVLRFHHVMVDGMGGLAMLTHLVDGMPPSDAADFPRPAPRTAALIVDAACARLAALSRPRRAAAALRGALAELRTPPTRAARCSLNQPVGARRAIAVARADLNSIHVTARRHGASINDVLLVAITGALARFLGERNEDVDHLVVSVPVSGRVGATATEPGNRIGVVAVNLPTLGPPADRVAAAATITRDRKRRGRDASSALLVALFRLLGAVRAVRWVTEHQHLVNTFVTNLRGPTDRVGFLGAPVADLIPINSTSGNVRLAFGVFSYAGTLTVTLVADAALTEDLPALVEHLQLELARIEAARGVTDEPSAGDVPPVAHG